MKVKFGGWHRVWVVLATLYLMLTIIIGYAEYPRFLFDVSSKEIVLSIEKQETTVIYGDKVKEALVEGHTWREVKEYLQKNKKLDTKTVNSFILITEKLVIKNRQFQFLTKLFLLWLLPLLGVYIAGWAGRWVHTGFKQEKIKI